MAEARSRETMKAPPVVSVQEWEAAHQRAPGEGEGGDARP